jgi:FG-GAP-like repeat
MSAFGRSPRWRIPCCDPMMPRFRTRIVAAVFSVAALGIIVAAGSTPGGSLPGPLPLFPVDNWWNLDISSAPVDPGSAAYVTFIGPTRGMHPDFGGDVSPGSVQGYGFPYAVVDGTVTKRAVQFQYADESDGVDHVKKQSVPFYPIPDEAITQAHWIEGGEPGNVDLRSNDRHLLIVDRDQRYLYELYNVFYDGSQWHAGSGAFFDMNVNGRRPDGWTSADAAGLAMLPGLVRYDEVFGSAEINHAFRVTVRATNGYVYPASHRAGSTSAALPMGARLRLKAGRDLSGFPPEAQKIFRAMQRYGLIVADNGSDLYVSGTYDARWNNGVLNPAFGALKATDFEVIQLGYHPAAPAAPSHLVDLDGDGRGDVFLYNKATGARAFEVAKASGGFTQTSSAWDPGWQVYPATLNADAYSDFFLYDPARGFWIQALNHGGDGTFTYTLGNWDSSWTVVPADLDGDGLTDMFVYNFSTGVWVKCFADGSGGFKGYAVGNWDPGWTFYTADLNGDGRDDFFLYNRVNGVWGEAFSQPGFGTFDYPASGQWDPGWQVIRADLNGDRRTDLFLLNAAGMHVSALSRASGGFDYVGGPQWAAGWSVSAGDLNGDGAADLFLYNVTTGGWVEAFSDSAGGFTYSTPGTWDPTWSIAVTDLNADRRGDIVLSRADGTWIQATNTGLGTFSYAAGNWGVGWTTFTRRN